MQQHGPNSKLHLHACSYCKKHSSLIIQLFASVFSFLQMKGSHYPFPHTRIKLQRDPKDHSVSGIFLSNYSTRYTAECSQLGLQTELLEGKAKQTWQSISWTMYWWKDHNTEMLWLGSNYLAIYQLNRICIISGSGLGIRVVGGKEIPGTNREIGAYIAKVSAGGYAEQTGKVLEGRNFYCMLFCPITLQVKGIVYPKLQFLP